MSARSSSRRSWSPRGWMTVLVLGLVVTGVAACSAPAGDPTEPTASVGQALQPVPWTGTWAASPQSCGTMFGQQTLRQVVRTSIGGSAARVQFSNVFGSASVDLSDVHVAVRTSGSSIDPATDRPVTFGGQSTTTIAAGGLAVSDTVAIAVPALGDVVVSMYLPQSTNVATCHQQGTETNYYVSGDVSGDANLNNPQTMASYYLLANLDVQNSAALGAVVTLGASITDGFASAQDANHRWPNFLATRLNAAGLTVGVLNQGINGNQLLVDGSGQSALHRFQRDVLAQPGVRWVIFSDDPINDLGDQNPPPTADALWQTASQLIAMAHQAGIAFLCSTLTPFQGASYWTSAGETGRAGYDAFVRTAGNGCDAIVDQDTATHNPAMPTWYLPQDDSGDHLHPNDDGRQAIADAVPFGLFAAALPPDAGGEGGSEAGAMDASSANDASSTHDAGGGGVVEPEASVGAHDADSSQAVDAGSSGAPASSGGCACRAAGPSSPAAPPLSFSLLGVAILSAARARRSRGRGPRGLPRRV